MFLKVSRLIFILGTFGWQADEYIAPRVMLFMVFCIYVCLWTGLDVLYVTNTIDWGLQTTRDLEPLTTLVR